ncbi:MAG TPA: EAL domain-containing protein [Burkholderiales bacterium]|nr:EAL domain-containing protein [Burkholderiales bacterium]
MNKAVQSLKANTDRLRDLCDNVPCGYHALNASGIFMEVNDTELRWLGCRREEVVGKIGFADFLDAASRDKFQADFANCKTSGVSRGTEFELLSRNGSRMTVIVSSSVSADANGNFVMTRSVVYDITQQMRASRALSATLDQTPNVAIQWFDRDGRVRYWNNASTRMFGWSVDEAIGRTLGELGLYTAAQGRDFVELLCEIDPEGSALEPEESTCFRKDGSQGVIVSTLFPIPSPSGEQYIACMNIDVTERHRSEERLRATLEHTPGVAVQWFDSEARVLYWNPASEMLYGIDADEALGRRMDELLVAPEDYREFIAFLETLKHAHNTSDETQITVRGRHGIDVTVLRRACIIPGERGEPIFVCMEVDITDAKAAEREREQLHTILTRVTETIPVCLSYLDVDGRYVWTNAHNSERLRTTPDRMIGKTAREVHMAATNGHWSDTLFDAARYGVPQHDECEWLGNDGVASNYERYVVPDIDVGGALRGCTSVWVDITARKEAEYKIQRLNRVHSVLSNIDAALVRTKNRQELFDEACRIAVQDGGFGVAWIGVFNRFTTRVDSVAWSGADAHDLQVMESLSRDLANAGCQLLARCIRTKKPIIENDMSVKNPSEGTLRRRAVSLGYESVIFLPLVVKDEVTGVFCMMSKEPNFFTEEEVRLLTNLSSDVAFAVEGIDKETRINYLAYYDLLTGLPNRTLFYERLGQLVQSAQQRESKLALLVVDIRRFRFVNESLGRQSADNLLSKVAERFLLSWPEPDNLGRIAGDRFAFALGAYDNNALLVHAIEQSIIEALKTPFQMDGQEVTVSAAAGIAVFPEDGADVETLFRNAEAAVGQAKSAAEPYMYYQPQMNARMAEGLLMENRMRRALDKEQFVVHYQPKIEVIGAQISGFEALIRWNDPETGMVAPGSFIPIMEETGMIVEAGQWAIRRVLRDHASWWSSGLNPPRIAVNVSAIQLQRKDFTDQIRALVAEAMSGEPALDLEITESLLMNDIEGSIKKLKIIRDMGVNIAIDDFGTGYSSLAYLSKLPVNALKIDRSFIDGMLRSDENMIIVSSIISLAHAMKLKVIAEGVETKEQLSVLKSLDCDEIQGYLISRPVAAEHAASMLREHIVEAASLAARAHALSESRTTAA